MKNPKDSIDGWVRCLETELSRENFDRFMSAAGPLLPTRIDLRLLAEQARVGLRRANQNSWVFLFEYYSDQDRLFPAICCAEALLTSDPENPVRSRYEHLLAGFRKRRSAEISRIKGTFAKNDPVVTISVIMPTHNRPNSLQSAIQSVLDQSYRDFEVVVVNDGGSRDCEDVIRSFHSKKIRYVYVKHGGLSRALNQGILNSRATYISYLDDDDLYLPDHLRTLVTGLQESDFPLVYTDGYRVMVAENGGGPIVSRKEVPYSLDFDPGRLSRWNCFPILCAGHRRDCFEITGLFERELPNMMDWELWVRFSRHFDFKHIRKITCQYHQHRSSRSLSGNRIRHLFYEGLLEAHFAFQAGEKWRELDAGGRGLMLEEAEKSIRRYTNDGFRLGVWLTPRALGERKWKKAMGLISSMVDEGSVKNVFLFLINLFPRISLPGFVFFKTVVFVGLLKRLGRFLGRMAKGNHE